MRKSTTIILILLLALSMNACTEPVFKLNGDDIMTIEAFSAFVDPGASISSDASITVDDPVDPTKPGAYVVTYTAKIGSKLKSLYRTVNVIDTKAPELVLNGSLDQLMCLKDRYKEEGYLAFDQVDGDLSSQVSIQKTGEGLLYRVMDHAGNLSEQMRIFTKRDTQRPSLTLKGEAYVIMALHGSYRDPGVSVWDNCGSTTKVSVTNTLNPEVLGQYRITYSVSDLSGNTSTVTRHIEVTDMATTTVYLTFDDGPDYATMSILDTLKERNIKATFFVQWNWNRQPSLIKREADEGHTVGLHSYRHQYNTIYASETAFYTDLNKISDYVYGITGIRSKIYRFPGGSSNTVSNFNPGIMTTLTQSIQEQGYVYFDWNVSSGDTSVFTEDAIVNNVIKGIRIGRTNIVLMHDGPNHALTAKALPHILDYLESINAVMLPLTMDSPQIHFKVAN